MKYILLSLLFLSGCSVNVGLNEFNWAATVCKNNGGLAKLHANLLNFSKASCKDGALFDYRDKKKLGAKEKAE